MQANRLRGDEVHAGVLAWTQIRIYSLVQESKLMVHHYRHGNLPAKPTIHLGGLTQALQALYTLDIDANSVDFYCYCMTLQIKCHSQQ